MTAAAATIIMARSHWTKAANFILSVGSPSTITVGDFIGAPRNW